MIVQKWHHYETWEEFHAGMWRIVSKEEKDVLLKKAIEFTGNAILYGQFMQRIIREWPISCEQHLSNLSMNRMAWIGHAACCLATGSPEYVTRLAWRYLTQVQQDDANQEAVNAIRKWEQFYQMQNTTMDNKMGIQGIFEWHS